MRYTAHRSHLTRFLSILTALTLFSCAAPTSESRTCGAISTFADGLQPTSELHVSPTGSDSAGDGSASNPFATIGHAATLAAPGTAIRVHSGTYAGGDFRYDLLGDVSAPIWIGGAPGESRPIIVGGSEGLHLIRPRYIVLHDLEVSGAASNGVNCDDGGDYSDPDAARYVVFRNLYIHDIGSDGNQDGLKLSGLDDFFVLDCEIARCGGGGSGSGVDHVGCHDGLISRCYFHDLSGNAVQCKGGSQSLEIRWCRLVEAGQRGVNIGGSTGPQYFRPPLSTTEPNVEARDIRVVANVIEGGVASLAFVGCVDSVAINNTIITPHNWILRILQETTTGGGYEFLPCGDNTFANNLAYFDRSDLSTYVNIGPNTAPTTFTFANDLWYAYNNPAQSTPNLPVAETDPVIGQDPLLTDPASQDYTIPAASPAHKSARNPAGVPGDITGTCYLRPPSIGAYEVPLDVLTPLPVGGVNEAER